MRSDIEVRSNFEKIPPHSEVGSNFEKKNPSHNEVGNNFLPRYMYEREFFSVVKPVISLRSQPF